jgi:UV DNA damage endonuclease
MKLATCCLPGNDSKLPKFSYRSMTMKSWIANADQSKLVGLWKQNIQLTEKLCNRLLEFPKQFHYLRVTSDLFPLVTLPDVWPIYQQHLPELQSDIALIGKKILAIDPDFRIVTHPGQFTLLNSENPEVNRKAVIDLQYHYDFMSAFGIPFNINIHLGCGPNKKDATGWISRFVDNYKALPSHLQTVLSLENDEKVADINTTINVHNLTGVKLCYDYHHQACYMAKEDRLGEYVYYNLSSKQKSIITNSWGGITPTCHLSNRKTDIKTWKDNFSHSDFLDDEVFNRAVVADLIANGWDLEVEAKAKIPAVQKFYKDYFENQYNKL